MSIRKGTSSVFVCEDNVPADLLAAALVKASQRTVPGLRGGAVEVTRMESTSDALVAKWESEFYDLDRRGYKRRRYKRSLIEREWEAMVKSRKQEAREAKVVAKGNTDQCDDCGSRWSVVAYAYGLSHDCEKGLVESE